MEAPFLNEIGIALGHAQNFLHSSFLKVHAFVLCGVDKRRARRNEIQLADLRVGEELSSVIRKRRFLNIGRYRTA
jgi:hypothetical protein